jgi:hypothetical protein
MAGRLLERGAALAGRRVHRVALAPLSTGAVAELARASTATRGNPGVRSRREAARAARRAGAPGPTSS